MKTVAMILALLCGCTAFCQKDSSTRRPLTKRIIVKTNLVNLAIARRPVLSVEKFLSPTLSLEASYVQGYFNRILLTDHYDYSGFLVRAKRYLSPPVYKAVAPYGGLYIGTLKRTIYTKGTIYFPLLFATSTRDFAANSIRAGFSFGASYTTQSRINIDLVMGAGYGKYIHYYKEDRRSKGYADAQLWLSVGYAF